MLEKKLMEELNRYKSINNYNYGNNKILMEQADPPAQDPTAVPPAPDAAGAPAPDAAAGATPPPPANAAGATPPPPAEEDTEEIDITDLVNITKSIKQDLDDNRNDYSGAIQKMDDVFTKLNDLESKLSEMDALMTKIDQLGEKVESMKPETPVEKLEMRSLDSYPFNEKPDEFFSHKQDEMRKSGKNEYVLTKDDVNTYSNDQIKQTFNPEQKENEYKF
jgi:hypothetical protein